jgi:4a-hydroxytetrahydrobiopterin dehydratase
MARPSKLSEDEIRERLRRLDGWQVVEGRLRREIRFASFVEAFGFMASLALVAESKDHHPDWSNAYNRVTIELCTHDVGGITELDFELAEAADRLRRG